MCITRLDFHLKPHVKVLSNNLAPRKLKDENRVAIATVYQVIFNSDVAIVYHDGYHPIIANREFTSFISFLIP